MDPQIEIEGRIEALARQRNVAGDEAAFHAGRVKALRAQIEVLQQTVTSLNEALAASGEKIRDLEAQLGEFLSEVSSPD